MIVYIVNIIDHQDFVPQIHLNSVHKTEESAVKRAEELNIDFEVHEEDLVAYWFERGVEE